MNLLITGSGTLATEILKQTYNNPDINRIVIYSRSEFNQYALKKNYPQNQKCNYFIGDIRDEPRLLTALNKIDTVIHAAAMKQIDTCEYNPFECIETNVNGSKRLINACNASKVNKCVFVSTDKAVSPTTLYGMSKACAERLFIDGNNMGSCRFSVVRYGNVLGSRGSVINLWKEQKILNVPITVTHPDMTRFFWTISDASKFILNILPEMKGGELFIPKMESYKIIDMAKQYSDKIDFIGLRPAEKMHEELITEDEAQRCYDNEKYYTIYPAFHDWIKEIEYKGVKVPKNFKLSSLC